MNVDDAEDKKESDMVEDVTRTLGEQFDAVVILCSRHEGARGTRTVAKGAGNWHARWGLVQEWLVTQDEAIRQDTRSAEQDEGAEDSQ